MLHTILKRAVITEKSIDRTRENYFTFEVVRSASKQQIKQAVESLFPVTVKDIKTMTRPGKTKRVGRLRKKIKKPNRRYAVVKLAKDQTIDLFSITPEETK